MITLPKAVIFDVDGTLLLRQGREPFDWELAHADVLNVPILQLAIDFQKKGLQVIVVSGREERLREVTETKLCAALGFSPDFYFRATGDARPDAIVKSEIYREFICGYFDVQYVFDDRNRTVQMWRTLGLPTLQVADGDF